MDGLRRAENLTVVVADRRDAWCERAARRRRHLRRVERAVGQSVPVLCVWPLLWRLGGRALCDVPSAAVSGEVNGASVDIESAFVPRAIVAQKSIFMHNPTGHGSWPHTPTFHRTRPPHARLGASAGAAAPLPLTHTIERISTRTCREHPGSPRQAHGERSGAHRAATPLSGPRGRNRKSGNRRVSARGAALAARGEARLIWACERVDQAHAVSGWRISKGARACEADGSPDGRGSGDAR